MRNPAIAGQERRDDVQQDEDLPRPRARQARGDRVVADRVEQPAVARPPEAEQDEGGQRQEDAPGCSAGSPRNAPGPERCAALRRRPAPVWTIRICHTLARPRTTRPMPRVMISGWTRKTPTPMPVTSAGQARRRRARRGSPTARPGPPTSVATHEPGHRRDRADRQVDAAGQHRQRLAAGEDRQRDGGPHDRARPSWRRRCPGGRAR